jgi:signal transduction histidine kinase
LLLSFVAVTIVPVATLVWLTTRIVRQDRALEQQTVRDRLERAADLIVATVERDLARFQGDLTTGLDSASAGRADAISISFIGDRVIADPRARLLYYPATSPSRSEPSGAVFASAEALEFQRQNYSAAISALAPLAQSRDSLIRAGALLRLARNHRKNQQPDRALAAYDDLSKLGNLPVGGVPAELLAREARCALLAESKRAVELLREATALQGDLTRGRWRLDRASYLFYANRARQWVGGSSGAEDETRLAIAGAVDRLWSDWQRARRGEISIGERRILWIDSVPVTVLTRASRDTIVALVAGPSFIEWRLRQVSTRENVAVSLTDPEGHRLIGASPTPGFPHVIRTAQESHLPWTLLVASANSSAELGHLADRRRLLLVGLALTALLTFAGGYFTVRATARELAVARLESDFVSAVSHEFRTPLTSLRHLTDLLENDAVTSDERRRQYYAVMARETERLQRMVERLLDFGRMEAGRRDYAFERLNVEQLVDDVVGEFRADIGASGRRIERLPTTGAAQLRQVEVDREAIGHAVRNLLDNAIKYSAPPAAVRIVIREAGARVAIRVSDEGVGIPEEEQRMIFDKFVRGSASREMNVRGTGVGLAMVRHIVRAHGGDVAVESELGRGSTFTIVLPLARGREAPDLAAQSRARLA